MSVFNHVGLCVTDVDRAVEFYTSVFGFEMRRTFEVPDSPTDRLLRLERPGLTAIYLVNGDFTLELLHFAREGNPPPRDRSVNEPGLTHLSFSVDDVRATADAAVRFGGAILEDTDVGAAIFIRDPDGQLLELLPMAYRQTIQG